MGDPYLYPKLRWPIDVRVEHIDNQEILVLACPIGVVESPLLLVPAVAPIISCFDGSKTLAEIAARFESYGIKHELLLELVNVLDQHLFLASPRFDAAEKTMRENFISLKTRPAALAGLSYPAGEYDLRQLVRNYISPFAQNGKTASSDMLGVVSPHIDYRRGGVCYGATYQRLSQYKHDLYIVIGTCHQFSQSLFQLTAKDFATPLGTLCCDTDFVQKLALGYGLERSFKDELLHRREHSIELQTPFLKHTQSEATIVPILVGSFHRLVMSNKEPQYSDEYENFIGTLTEITRQQINQSRRVCVLAGVDMAHVGMNFGDTQPLNDGFLEEIKRRDLQYLEAISKQDKAALFAHIVEDQDRRRICGFPTMYTVIDLFDRLGLRYTSELFDYRQAVDTKTDCCVSFAGMGLYKQ